MENAATGLPNRLETLAVWQTTHTQFVTLKSKTRMKTVPIIFVTDERAKDAIPNGKTVGELFNCE